MILKVEKTSQSCSVKTLKLTYKKPPVLFAVRIISSIDEIDEDLAPDVSLLMPTSNKTIIECHIVSFPNCKLVIRESW